MSFPRLAAAALSLAAVAVIAAGYGGSSSSASPTSASLGGNPTTVSATQVSGPDAVLVDSGGLSSTAGAGTPVAANPATASAAGTTISLGSAAGVGKVLVNSKGFTLYLFQKDRKGSGKSTCGGACAKAWPPVTTKGKPQAGSGVKSALLGTIKRPDGTTQVTYAGWPLYGFIMDKKRGEDNGTGLVAFGGSWFPLHSNGKKAG